jgi:periplasmic protein TonB
MKFIALHSRGGNYLVVASNVAWLRTAENGQTLVGIVGGQPLLVAGSIDEIAAQLSGDKISESPSSTPEHSLI